MTGDLAFDLRGFARELFHGRQVDQYATDRILEAADRLEALEAKVEGLREALRNIDAWGDEWAASKARAALGVDTV